MELNVKLTSGERSNVQDYHLLTDNASGGVEQGTLSQRGLKAVQ